MGLPYKIATLLYVFNARDEILLIERAQQPNLGLWSPPGGKLRMDVGESPYACACREAQEEMGIRPTPSDLHLTGMVSESGYAGESHWLMFLFEVKILMDTVPASMHEGRFAFHSREALKDLAIPRTDREVIWPWFWRHRGGFFSAHCRCSPEFDEWEIMTSLPALDGNKDKKRAREPEIF